MTMFGDKTRFAAEVGQPWKRSVQLRRVDLWAAGHHLTCDDNTVFVAQFVRAVRGTADALRGGGAGPARVLDDADRRHLLIGPEEGADELELLGHERARARAQETARIGIIRDSMAVPIEDGGSRPIPVVPLEDGGRRGTREMPPFFVVDRAREVAPAFPFPSWGPTTDNVTGVLTTGPAPDHLSFAFRFWRRSHPVASERGVVYVIDLPLAELVGVLDQVVAELGGLSS